MGKVFIGVIAQYYDNTGAFLIPYVLNLIFTGLPLFFFELSLGQYASSSPIALWSIVPLFQGRFPHTSIMK